MQDAARVARIGAMMLLAIWFCFKGAWTSVAILAIGLGGGAVIYLMSAADSLKKMAQDLREDD